MANRSMRDQIDLQLSILPLLRTATATGAAVDLWGFDAATLVAFYGTSGGTIGTNSFTVHHSTDNSNWGTAGTECLLGTFAPVTAVGGLGSAQRVGYIGGRRYVRMIYDPTSSGTLNVGAGVIRGYASQEPVA